jgi:hypothetical protein
MTRTYDAVGNRRSLLAEFVVGANVTKDFKNEFYDYLGQVIGQTQKTFHNEPSKHPWNPHHHVRDLTNLDGIKFPPGRPGVHPEYEYLGDVLGSTTTARSTGNGRTKARLVYSPGLNGDDRLEK